MLNFEKKHAKIGAKNAYFTSVMQRRYAIFVTLININAFFDQKFCNFHVIFLFVCCVVLCCSCKKGEESKQSKITIQF